MIVLSLLCSGITFFQEIDFYRTSVQPENDKGFGGFFPLSKDIFEITSSDLGVYGASTLFHSPVANFESLHLYHFYMEIVIFDD